MVLTVALGANLAVAAESLAGKWNTVDGLRTELLRRGLSFEAVQYVINPGAAPNLRNAIVGAVRLQPSF